MEKKENLLKELLALTPNEKADIIDKVLKSLDEPDEKIDTLWKEESEKRIDAYENGDIPSVSVNDTFSKYKKNG
jgi:putative addiction module component (TIGR02574 family)